MQTERSDGKKLKSYRIMHLSKLKCLVSDEKHLTFNRYAMLTVAALIQWLCSISVALDRN